MGEFGDGTTGGTPPPPPPPGYEPFQPLGAPPPKQKKAFWSKKGVGLLVGFAVLLGIGAFQSYRRDHGTPFNTPATIGNATLMTDAESLAAAKEFREEVENVHRAVSGLYAVNGVPTFVMLAGDADDDSAQSVFDTFRKETGDKVTASRRVGDVICARVEDEDLPAIACFWGGSKSDGILFHYGTKDFLVAGKVAQQVRDGVEA
jgi:hypothetical protein